MLFAECKKIFIKQRGLLIIVIMVLLKIGLTLYQGYDSSIIINRNPEGYAFYISHYEGKLTEKKGKELQVEYYQVGHAKGELDELVRQWHDGKITKEEYEKTSKKYYEMMKNTSAFNVLYNQYYYAKAAPEERYIMDERGWTTLLSHNKPDIILLLCLVIVLTPIFCAEYESGMDSLLLSSKKGKYKIGIIKLSCGCVLALLISALFSMIEYLCIYYMVGLNHGGYPLQSLEFFANSEYHISLNEVFLLMVLCRMLGAALLAACISVVGIISKKSIITLFMSSILAFIPYIIFSGRSTEYYLPLPSGLLSGIGYFWGTSYKTSFDGKEMVKLVEFQRIEKGMFAVLLVGYVMEIGLLFLYSIKKYSRSSLKTIIVNIKSRKVLSLLCIIGICTVTCTGCGTTDKVPDSDSYTFNAQKQLDYGETAGYGISFDIEKGIITAKNLKTGENICLTREPFKQEWIISAMYVRDGFCYYLTQRSGIEGIKEGVRVFGINMKDFKQTLIYNSVRENTEDYFGIDSNKDELLDSNKSKFIDQVNYFFLNKDNIYYVDNSELIRIDRKTGRESVEALDLNGCLLVYHNGDIYYVDNQYRLCIFKEKDGRVHPVDSVYTDNFDIKGNRLLYRSLLGDKQIQSYNIIS